MVSIEQEVARLSKSSPSSEEFNMFADKLIEEAEDIVRGKRIMMVSRAPGPEIFGRQNPYFRVR